MKMNKKEAIKALPVGSRVRVKGRTMEGTVVRHMYGLDNGPKVRVLWEGSFASPKEGIHTAVSLELVPPAP